MRYRDLVEDGHVPGLLVHPDWWEPKHPQETPPDMHDPVALYRPAPEISVETGYGNPEAPLPAPTTPSTAARGTLASAAMIGVRFITIAEATTYDIGQWLFIELNGGGTYFVSRIATSTDSPTFVIPFATEFAGAADGGNNFFIEAG